MVSVETTTGRQQLASTIRVWEYCELQVQHLPKDAIDGWVRDGWELVGMHQKRRGRATALVAIMRRVRQAEAAVA